MSKKILVISFFSPPSSAISAVRITKFIKYLIRFGWEVTLLTVKEKYFDHLNFETLKDIQGAKIIRTDIIKPIKGLKEWGWYWLPYLKKELENLLLKEKFDISLWTGNPFYHWILAPQFKKKYGLKYLLDFRDEWSLSNIVKNWHGSYFYRFKRYLDNYLAKFLEPYIIKNSDAVINVTEEVTELYKTKYKKFNTNRFYTIYNGFDLDDLNFEELPKENFFEIIYPGRFGKFLNPSKFFEAFYQLTVDEHLTSDQIKLTLVGSENDIKIRIQKIGLIDYVNFLEKQPYHTTLGLIKRSDLGFLILHNLIDTSTKVFDYIAMNIKIFCVTDVDNARGAKICKDYGNAIVVKNSVNDIKVALKEAYFNRADLPINKNVLNFYNREFQTKRLEYILNDIIERGDGNEKRN